MAKKAPADDLFEQSSMSFGEHLEELRKALIKAFIWLGIGTAVGLYFSQSIVKGFQTPLEAAIREFRVQQAKDSFQEANGSEPSKEMVEIINTLGLTPEVRYVDPDLLTRATTQESDLPQETRPAPVKAPAEAKKPSKDEEAEKDEKNKEDKATEKKAEKDDQTAEGSMDETTSEVALSSEFINVLSKTNPWKDVDRASLGRLRSFIIWQPINTNLVSLEATEGFMIYLKAALIAGVVLGSPGIFFHVWQFFAAGMYPHERRYVYWYLPLSLLLFLAGVSLAFFVIFKLVLGFLMMYTNNLGVDFTPRLTDYMSFALFLPLGFGVAFQLPLVMLGLHRFGVVKVDLFISQWRIAVLAISFLSMLLTPAEPYSMIGLAVPLVCLYFLGILLCKYMPVGAGVGSSEFDPQN